MNIFIPLFQRWFRLWLGCLAIISTAHAEIIVPDDAGRMLALASPARRIVSLAPNVTELLYAAGAGNFVVGSVAYSDYPEAAKSIPRVGGGAGLDIEAVVALHPRSCHRLAVRQSFVAGRAIDLAWDACFCDRATPSR